jgi:hypothetical protein
VRLVLIEWLDSFGCSSNWTEIDKSEPPKPLVCRSVGWLLHDGKDCKVVIPHISDVEHKNAAHQGCGDMTIPTKSIVRISSLVPTSSGRAVALRKL